MERSPECRSEQIRIERIPGQKEVSFPTLLISVSILPGGGCVCLVTFRMTPSELRPPSTHDRGLTSHTASPSSSLLSTRCTRNAETWWDKKKTRKEEKKNVGVKYISRMTRKAWRFPTIWVEEAGLFHEGMRCHCHHSLCFYPIGLSLPSTLPGSAVKGSASRTPSRNICRHQVPAKCRSACRQSQAWAQWQRGTVACPRTVSGRSRGTSESKRQSTASPHGHWCWRQRYSRSIWADWAWPSVRPAPSPLPTSARTRASPSHPHHAAPPPCTSLGTANKHHTCMCVMCVRMRRNPHREFSWRNHLPHSRYLTVDSKREQTRTRQLSEESAASGEYNLQIPVTPAGFQIAFQMLNSSCPRELLQWPAVAFSAAANFKMPYSFCERILSLFLIFSGKQTY